MMTSGGGAKAWALLYLTEMWIVLHLGVKRGSSVWFEFVFDLVFRVGMLCGRGYNMGSARNKRR